MAVTTHSPRSPQRLRTTAWRLAAGLGASLVLLAVFSLYTDPDFFFTVATQVWACF